MFKFSVFFKIYLFFFICFSLSLMLCCMLCNSYIENWITAKTFTGFIWCLFRKMRRAILFYTSPTQTGDWRWSVRLPEIWEFCNPIFGLSITEQRPSFSVCMFGWAVSGDWICETIIYCNECVKLDDVIGEKSVFGQFGVLNYARVLWTFER